MTITDSLAEVSQSRALTLLTDLVRIDTINPMGTAVPTRPVEHEACDYIEAFFADLGVDVVRDGFSPSHENLSVLVPGATAAAATMFESHVDTVPADDWRDRALVPRVEGSVVYGRGTADDKASLVAMMLALESVIRSGATPPQPVLFLAAGDEEYAQTGIKHFRTLEVPVARGVFGEPSDLAPIVQHKGTVRWDITALGRSAHSSRPHLGVNAIHAAFRVIEALERHQAELAERYQSPLMTGPTLTVTMISGGRTRNAVPDECRLSVDYRCLPGQQPDEARGEVIDLLARAGLDVQHSDVQLMTPPLATDPTDGFALSVLAACRARRPEVELAGVPYGTDASWITDLGPALVLGPGSIDTAHAIDEWVDVRDIVTCAGIYRDVMLADHLDDGT
jgi:acetylornithine deacetylase